MNIALITPVPAQSRQGNRVTALRWARILKALGHRVTIAQHYDGKAYALMVALHARRSFAAIECFQRLYPERPLLVALTGTDLYGDIHTSAEAQHSLELATRLILLQPRGIDELAVHLHPKVRVIYQSVPTLTTRPPKARDTFDVCVLGHLRPVKDPFRTALAARMLPADSRLRVLHVGKALDDDMDAYARAEMAANPRYRWLGELPRWQALRVLARSRLLVLSSLTEGGANVISEALALGVPIVASRIAGSLGLLGDDYPGYFPVEDTAALACLLEKVERDTGFYDALQTCGARLAPLVHPAREQQTWASLLDELPRA
ncbi:MAG: TIGR04348 family glycosyltransferase [Candidatus Tectomicrobia bacterium]|uniref:TIGR04348 family glycosyltransferase n=1 Tax=Tectimicrobiota bacterium TaxID=2528274 RepID=A0A937W0Q0_UNCTE|nr:TIGR04348 family glycosyltransferase [Candidatus Tectomicrobia bacterium]